MNKRWVKKRNKGYSMADNFNKIEEKWLNKTVREGGNKNILRFSGMGSEIYRRQEILWKLFKEEFAVHFQLNTIFRLGEQPREGGQNY